MGTKRIWYPKSKLGIKTIGADPEFHLIRAIDDSIISASSVKFFNHVGALERIGKDGGGLPVEIRPRASKINEINKFNDEITDILKKIANFCNTEGYYIMAGGSRYGSPIGGHIHFGCKELINNREKIVDFTKKMDTLFMPLLHLIISPEYVRRRCNGYGSLGSYRLQPHGVEYRTPFCFVISPFITKTFYFYPFI